MVGLKNFIEVITGKREDDNTLDVKIIGQWDDEEVVRQPGQACGHPGCLSHVTHPCERCGRIAGH